MESTTDESRAPRRPVALVLSGVAVAGLTFGAVLAFRADGSPTSLATIDTTAVTTSSSSPAPSTTDAAPPVFIDASSSVTPPPSTVRSTVRSTVPKRTTRPTTTKVRPTTTAATTTTIPTATLPEQPRRPIAPPTDPNAAEAEIQLGAIAIPKLGVEAPLFEGIRLSTLDNGPGHWPGTAMPGEVGNVVVAGHRTSHGGPFRHIDTLVEGDVVEFTTSAGVIEYTVTSTMVVEPDAVWIVDPTSTPTATLFACHPPGSVRQRIVVNLELADDLAGN